MKVSVIGSCQAVPLAACLSMMNPTLRVEAFLWDRDPGAAGDDHVIFRQRNRRTVWAQHERRPGEFLYPRIWFNAFHPDLAYVAGPYGAVPPPLGDYHSSLALYGWHRGMRAAETARLFCEPVFERLSFFDFWSPAREALLGEGRDLEFPIADMLPRWERRGWFMYAPNHPVLFVMADIARELARRAGLDSALSAPEYYLNDPMLDEAVWPLYPGIAERLGLPGAYHFKPGLRPGTPPLTLDLAEFIARSFEAYENMSSDALVCTRLERPAYRDLEHLAAGERKRPSASVRRGDERPNAAARAGSPYADLPSSQFWRHAVAQVHPEDVDPTSTPAFRIDRRTRIATVGSCFAQHMSSALEQHGYTFFVAEPPPAVLTPPQARQANYGVFSTRSGNVYTARQLVQLFDRAYGTFAPSERAWKRPDGRYADPFRALVEPDGFASEDELLESRERHLAAVRFMFERLDVLIFTLGLTEAWRSIADGAVFSAAPGSVAGNMDPSRHEFVNFSAADVRADLEDVLARLRSVNDGANVVLTVSPIPLIATYEPAHVLLATTYSKAALRVAAHEVDRANENVWYFPSYELITGDFTRGAYFERDLRTVTPAGVHHVMRLFLAHCAHDASSTGAEALAMLAENARGMDVVCDEETATLGDPRDDFEAYLSRDLPGGGTPGIVAQPSEGHMERLDAAAMRATIDADLMTPIAARTVVTAPCTVVNRGDVALATAEPYPVYLSYRWFDEAGAVAEIGHSIHASLSPALVPGAAATIALRIEAPRFAGRYALRVSLLQSNVAWFDDVDPNNGLKAVVDVVEKSPNSPPIAASIA